MVAEIYLEAPWSIFGDRKSCPTTPLPLPRHAEAVGRKPSAKTGFPQYQTTSVRALDGGKQGGPKFIIVSSEKF